jgi:hypothetical protein
VTELSDIDPAVLCIDMFGPDARRQFRIPDNAPPRPPHMAPSGSPISAGCMYTLAAPLSLVADANHRAWAAKVKQREVTTDEAPRNVRSLLAFEGWVIMVNNHKQLCAHCREATWMPL